MATQKRLYRSRTDRQIAGVAAGLAEYLGIDPTLVRLGFVLLALAGGPGLLLYIIMWMIVPEAPEDKSKWVDEDITGSPNITMREDTHEDEF